VDKSYELAIKYLGKAQTLSPDDYRPRWFLGMHECQSNDVVSGMKRLLAIEEGAQSRQLPTDFWLDYIHCSTVSMMPGHTLRAAGQLKRLGVKESDYQGLVDIARGRYDASSPEGNYSAQQAWESSENGGSVEFTSNLCGVRFSASGEWRVQLSDVDKRTCTAQLESGPYKHRSGNSAPTMLLLSRPPKPQEALIDFASSFLQGKYSLAMPYEPPSCPTSKCIGFEVVTKALYEAEGGGHFLVVVFANEPPEFEGITFEKPKGPPKQVQGAGPSYYRAVQIPHRLPGTLYCIVLLDSNALIFDRAARDFSVFLKSLQLD
jgi:hypothetical protein